MSELAHSGVPTQRPRWVLELIAAWGFAQRNFFLTKRYLLWEIVWLAYATVSAMSIGFIGVDVEGGVDGARRRPADPGDRKRGWG